MSMRSTSGEVEREILIRDKQTMKFSFISTLLFILLTGCSAPINSVKPQFTPNTSVSTDMGSVKFSTLDTSKWDLAYAFVFGAQPLPVSIYDITDDLFPRSTSPEVECIYTSYNTLKKEC